jgi:hypothetical protein
MRHTVALSAPDLVTTKRIRFSYSQQESKEAHLPSLSYDNVMKRDKVISAVIGSINGA